MKRIESRRTFLYFDCFNGISGDMACGALAQLSGDFEVPARVIEALGLAGVEARVEKRISAGLSGFGLSVEAEEGEVSRRLGDVVELFAGSRLPPDVVSNCVAAFEKLASTEARVHGTSPEDVHFHEVGAVDSMLDVAVFFTYLHELSPSEVFSSPLPYSSGRVDTAHGKLPVPAPATLDLASRFGVRWVDSDVEGEIVTPTGVLLLAQAGARFEEPKDFVVERIGYGVGEREFRSRPNVLRVSMGRLFTRLEGDRVFVVETNVDDVSPEGIGYLFERVFAAGAFDFTVTPATMKKNRPGWTLTAVLPEAHLDSVLTVLFAHTTTIGVRVMEVERHKLTRESDEVETRWGRVRVKLVDVSGGFRRAVPEYDDVKRISDERGLPMDEVVREVLEIWRRKR